MPWRRTNGWALLHDYACEEETWNKSCSGANPLEMQ
jgi:hypothetical protein